MFRRLQTLFVFGAVFCFAIPASGLWCNECNGVATCDCNCKNVQCYANYDAQGNLTGAYYFSPNSCVPTDPAPYVTNGTYVTCARNGIMAIYSGVGPTPFCTGCSKIGKHEATCGQGVLITDSGLRYTCLGS